MNVRHTAIEARKGKPGYGTMREPKAVMGTFEQGRRRGSAGCRWGLVSGIVL